MSITNYLVDYENVHERGLNGMSELPETDRVYLFFTENAMKISLEYLENIRVSLTVKKVPRGKQSLDMHLSSFLGYLIGRSQDDEDQYVILSSDTDYAGVAEFWCKQFGNKNKVTIRPNIIVPAQQPKPAAKKAEKVDPQEALAGRILRTIRRYGEQVDENTMRLPLSRLCTILRNDATYNALRKKNGNRAMKTMEVFAESISVCNCKGIDWVYDAPGYVPETEEEPTEMPAEAPVEEAVAQDIVESVPEEMEVAEEIVTEEVSEEQAEPEEPAQEIPEEPAEEEAPASVEEEPAQEAAQPDPMIEQLSELFRAGGMQEDYIADAASLVAENLAANAGRRKLYGNVLKKYGGKVGRTVYASIRNIMTAAAGEQEENTEE